MTDGETRYELTAAVVLWRGPEILVMKRAAGFSAGGWFLPGGHVEPGERPVDAAVRELFEETGITANPDLLALADVMTYAHDGATAHGLIYNAACPPGADATLNDEHVFARWMTPEAYIARFLDAEMLRSRGVGEGPIALATEVARVVRAAARARGAAEQLSEVKPTNW
ncbi:MAG: NUDIX hydrolase [Dehalococcoidia bacterium]|nr:NUDIX hydrolase [Dehalococcoidia bacterium]